MRVLLKLYFTFTSDREISVALFKSLLRVLELYPVSIINPPDLTSSFHQTPVLPIPICVSTDVSEKKKNALCKWCPRHEINNVLSLSPAKHSFALSGSPVNYNSLNLDTRGHEAPSLTSTGVTTRRYSKLPAGFSPCFNEHTLASWGNPCTLALHSVRTPGTLQPCWSWRSAPK